MFVRSSKDIEEFKKTVLYYRLYMLSRRPLASNCCELPSRTNLVCNRWIRYYYDQGVGVRCRCDNSLSAHSLFFYWDISPIINLYLQAIHPKMILDVLKEYSRIFIKYWILVIVFKGLTTWGQFFMINNLAWIEIN